MKTPYAKFYLFYTLYFEILDSIVIVSSLQTLFFHKSHFNVGTSPVVMHLSPGRHTFKIVPQGCGPQRKVVKVKFEV